MLSKKEKQYIDTISHKLDSYCDGLSKERKERMILETLIANHIPYLNKVIQNIHKINEYMEIIEDVKRKIRLENCGSLFTYTHAEYCGSEEQRGTINYFKSEIDKLVSENKNMIDNVEGDKNEK